MNIRKISQAVKTSLCLYLTALLLSSSLVIGNVQPAFADVKMAGAMQNRAEQKLDKADGAGTAKQIKGRAEADLGRVQRKVGEVTDDVSSQVEGATKQIQGRANEDIGRAQSAAESAADQIEDTGESLIDSVKDFFN